MIPALLAGAAIASLAAMIVARRHAAAWLVATITAAVLAFAAAASILATGVTWNWLPGLVLGQVPVHLRLDALSAAFLALLAVVGAASACFSFQYWPNAAHPRSAPAGRLLWNFILTSMAVVLMQANGLHFLIAWELFTLSAYFLITCDRQRREVRRAGWLYLAASHAGTLCLFAFFAALAARTGSWDLGSFRDRPELAPLFWLALAGFGLKAGLFPLHVWLPSAHANAPTHVSALLSGVAIKMGIYGLMRFSGWLPLPDASGWTVAALGVISAVLGVVFALGQHDLKRLLAYHSVENIGIILIGLGFAIIARDYGQPAWGALAFAGSLLHVWNHGLFKSLLFLGAGSVLHATGTREMSRLGGLWRSMPWTAACFTLGAAAISGLPPLNGFISEWLIYLGLFDSAAQRGSPAIAAIPAAILLAVTGALALACFVKVVGVVFLGAPRSDRVARAHEAGPYMRTPMLFLGALCAAIGLAPVCFWPGLAHAIAEWCPEWQNPAAPPALLTLGLCNCVFAALAALAVAALFARARHNGIRRAGTWDCGYAAPTARMQYTAGSFAEIITGWFAWILRPERSGQPVQGIFPLRAEAASRTPETVLEKVIAPVGGAIMALSTVTRRLQHGRLQLYLVYVLIGMAALALLAFLGGRR